MIRSNWLEQMKRLRQEINQVQHDPSKLEQLARDQLGMVREDEIVYQFVEPNTKKSRRFP